MLATVNLMLFVDLVMGEGWGMGREIKGCRGRWVGERGGGGGRGEEATRASHTAKGSTLCQDINLLNTPHFFFTVGVGWHVFVCLFVCLF